MTSYVLYSLLYNLLFWTPLLGWRYFFNHYPGHWIPSCVSVTLFLRGALAYPEFNSNRAPCEVLATTFEGMMAEDIRSPTSPVSVKDWIDRHRTTAFIAVKLKIPSVTCIISIDSNVSLVGDFHRRVAVQLVKRTFLKQKNAKIRPKE